jgi:hypothetical protein
LDDFRRVLSQEYYPDAKTLRSAGHAAGNMWRFLREIKVGDVVLVPHREDFYVAEVTGEPSHDPAAPEGGFRRSTRWLNEKRPYVRPDQPKVYEALLERKTCYRVDLSLRPAVYDFVEHLFADTAIAEDIAQVNRRQDLDETTRKALVAARVGQGRYREGLLAAWGVACAVTGCAVLRAVRASHAKPWRESTDAERLDVNNGLPLLANLDALFDSGLIAFEDSGAMLISGSLPVNEHAVLGIPAQLRVKPTASQAQFLRYHREHQFIA